MHPHACRSIRDTHVIGHTECTRASEGATTSHALARFQAYSDILVDQRTRVPAEFVALEQSRLVAARSFAPSFVRPRAHIFCGGACAPATLTDRGVRIHAGTHARRPSGSRNALQQLGFACFPTNAATREVPASTCQIMIQQVCWSARWRGLRPEQRASARHCGCEVAYGIARAPMSTSAYPQSSAPLQTETCSHARAQTQLDLRKEVYACTGTSSPVIPRYCEERS